MVFGLAQTRTPGKAYKSRYDNTTHCDCDSCSKTRALFEDSEQPPKEFLDALTYHVAATDEKPDR